MSGSSSARSGDSEETAVAGKKECREQLGEQWGTFRLRSLDYLLWQQGIMRDFKDMLKCFRMLIAKTWRMG